MIAEREGMIAYLEGRLIITRDAPILSVCGTISRLTPLFEKSFTDTLVRRGLVKAVDFECTDARPRLSAVSLSTEGSTAKLTMYYRTASDPCLTQHETAEFQVGAIWILKNVTFRFDRSVECFARPGGDG